MNILNKKEPLLLLLGDISVLAGSLWFSLFLRFQVIPRTEIFILHLIPFAILFVIWIVTFFIAGLYETHRVIIRNRLPEILIKTQIINSVIAIAFFYFFPHFNITPKTVLSVFILISLVFISIWRIGALYIFVSKKKQKALLIGTGKEAEDLFVDVNKTRWHNFEFVSRINPDSLHTEQFYNNVLQKIKDESVEVVVIDTSDEKVTPFLASFYSLLFAKIQFIEFQKLYGEVFYKMPLGKLKYEWFVRHISVAKYGVYDLLKRTMDILLAIPCAICAIPFVCGAAIALKIQDRGPVFGIQTRVGRFGAPIKIFKLRTMLFNDDGNWQTRGKVNKVTKVGAFLRKTRIDELPQLINVIRGDISLIGPRPEFPDAVSEYKKGIPYYDVRHMIKPGLSGWAQIYHEAHPHHGVDIEETKNKLAYDLFYIKNRSIVLDIMIALKTVKTFLSREGK